MKIINEPKYQSFTGEVYTSQAECEREDKEYRIHIIEELKNFKNTAPIALAKVVLLFLMMNVVQDLQSEETHQQTGETENNFPVFLLLYLVKNFNSFALSQS